MIVLFLQFHLPQAVTLCYGVIEAVLAVVCTVYLVLMLVPFTNAGPLLRVNKGILFVVAQAQLTALLISATTLHGVLAESTRALMAALTIMVRLFSAFFVAQMLLQLLRCIMCMCNICFYIYVQATVRKPDSFASKSLNVGPYLAVILLQLICVTFVSRCAMYYHKRRKFYRHMGLY